MDVYKSAENAIVFNYKRRLLMSTCVNWGVDLLSLKSCFYLNLEYTSIYGMMYDESLGVLIVTYYDKVFWTVTIYCTSKEYQWMLEHFNNVVARFDVANILIKLGEEK